MKKELQIIKDVVTMQNKFLDIIYEQSVENYLKEKKVIKKDSIVLYKEILKTLEFAFQSAFLQIEQAAEQNDIELE